MDACIMLSSRDYNYMLLTTSLTLKVISLLLSIFIFWRLWLDMVMFRSCFLIFTIIIT